MHRDQCVECFVVGASFVIDQQQQQQQQQAFFACMHVEGVCINRPRCKSYPSHKLPICHIVVNSSAFPFIFCLHMLCLVRSRIYVSVVLGCSRTWKSQHPMVNWIFVTLFIVIWWWQWWGSMFQFERTFKTTQVALLRWFFVAVGCFQQIFFNFERWEWF